MSSIAVFEEEAVVAITEAVSTVQVTEGGTLTITQPAPTVVVEADEALTVLTAVTTVEVEPEPETVTVLEEAVDIVSLVVAIGPPGPIGPMGPAGSTYEHQQATPSSTWTVIHGLGFRPNVSIFETDGDEIEGDIVHVSLDSLTVSFSASVTGKAILS